VPVNKVKAFEAEFILILKAQYRSVLDNFRAGKFEDADAETVKKVALELASKY
jgi:F-type H+-transporting ATPase subunit alpha